ncbi:MAG: hypothetical protein BM485_01865 [Desulfobulbaceae bacterium DB1]|nr:MAG: hypothetical protein BM485_01865 [Desulfobulbaceae bacterium DB1]
MPPAMVFAAEPLVKCQRMSSEVQAKHEGVFFPVRAAYFAGERSKTVSMEPGKAFLLTRSGS